MGGGSYTKRLGPTALMEGQMDRVEPTPETVAAALEVKEYEGHTLGPWEANVGAPPQWWVTVSGEKFHVIATTTQGNDEANARLIAEAPTLLKDKATLAELSRQLREDLKGVVALCREYEHFGAKIPDEFDEGQGVMVDDAEVTLTLWPEEVRG